MLIPSNYWQTDDAFPGLHHGSESLIYTRIRKYSYIECKIQNQCPHLIQLCICNRWQNRNEYTCSVLLWQTKATLCAAQQLPPEHSAAQLFCKCVPELQPLTPGLSLSFSAFPFMQILKNFSTAQEYRGIKHGGFNSGLDFCKTHQSHKDSELRGALKTMPGRIWKGPARNISSGGFSAKKYKGHWVKVSWEACKQEKLPIKGTPSEHNVLSDCFIRISIYNCFLLLWTENDWRL